MTVLQFRARRPGDGGRAAAEPGVPSADEVGVAVAVTGSFRSPIGGRGRFIGSFRLERYGDDARAVAVGVFAGVLRDAEDNVIGLAARRQSSPARLSREPGVPGVVLHPACVDLLGFQVRLDPVVVPLLEAQPGEALRVGPQRRPGVRGPDGARARVTR